ncbi:MAG: hypothetical protein V1684_00950 [bacterium]
MKPLGDFAVFLISIANFSMEMERGQLSYLGNWGGTPLRSAKLLLAFKKPSRFVMVWLYNAVRTHFSHNL